MTDKPDVLGPAGGHQIAPVAALGELSFHLHLQPRDMGTIAQVIHQYPYAADKKGKTCHQLLENVGDDADRIRAQERRPDEMALTLVPNLGHAASSARSAATKAIGWSIIT